MRVADIMSEHVKTIAADAAANLAWQSLKKHDVNHMVVMDKDRVVGVVSSRDLGGERGAARRKNAAVSDLMTRQAVTARPKTTVRQAANLIRGRNSLGCRDFNTARMIS